MKCQCTTNSRNLKRYTDAYLFEILMKSFERFKKENK